MRGRHDPLPPGRTSDSGLDALEAELAGTVFAGGVALRGVVDSTIDLCRQLADEGAPEGIVVIASGQRKGRGQHGRTWFSPQGGALYLSALLRPSLSAQDVSVLTPMAGTAAWLAAREGFGVPVVMKRPNDLVVPDWTGSSPSGWRKLGGVLVDTSIQGTLVRHAIVSLGLNLTLGTEDFPLGLRAIATSIWQETGTRVSQAAAAGAFLRRLSDMRRDLDARGLVPWSANVEARYREIARDLPEVEGAEGWES
jgi:BirA family biotin operon repressor/biotin-[acetyl-CoA-carboxylase] ligase